MRDGGTRSIPLKSLQESNKKRGAAVAEAFVPQSGLRLGRYELVTPIAQGGMAQVWVARLIGELGFSRAFALKTIRSDYAQDAGFRKAFLEEARISARLLHANVVEVTDLGEEGSTLYLVMPLVEGDSLRLLQQKEAQNGAAARLPLRVCLRIVVDALAGLHAAHELKDEHGVSMKLVHRDVSPQNILIGIDGVTRLTDFGVAKALGRLVDETRVGQLRGKFGYMSPEQLDGAPADRRADIFAAGIILWEMLTGERLFPPTDDLLIAIANIAEKKIKSPREIRGEVPKAIANIALKALSREKDGRFQTAAQMGDALELAAHENNILASTKEVGSWVWGLTSERIEHQRRAVAGASDVPEANADVEFPKSDAVVPAVLEDGLRSTVVAPMPGEISESQDLEGPPSFEPKQSPFETGEFDADSMEATARWDAAGRTPIQSVPEAVKRKRLVIAALASVAIGLSGYAMYLRSSKPEPPAQPAPLPTNSTAEAAPVDDKKVQKRVQKTPTKRKSKRRRSSRSKKRRSRRSNR